MIQDSPDESPKLPLTPGERLAARDVPSGHLDAAALQELDRRKRAEWEDFERQEAARARDGRVGRAQLPLLHRNHADALDPSGEWGRVLARLSTVERGIFALIGPRGSGKTQVAVNWMLAHIDQGQQPLFVTQTDLSTQIRATFRPQSSPGSFETEDSILRRCRFASLLVIDEVGRDIASEWSDKVLFELVNKRYERGRPTLFIGNVEKGQIGTVLGPSIVSRMEEDGGVIWLGERNYRELRRAE